MMARHEIIRRELQEIYLDITYIVQYFNCRYLALRQCRTTPKYGKSGAGMRDQRRPLAACGSIMLCPFLSSDEYMRLPISII
jgi:hypothetical protein